MIKNYVTTELHLYIEQLLLVHIAHAPLLFLVIRLLVLRQENSDIPLRIRIRNLTSEGATVPIDCHTRRVVVGGQHRKLVMTQAVRRIECDGLLVHHLSILKAIRGV